MGAKPVTVAKELICRSGNRLASPGVMDGAGVVSDSLARRGGPSDGAQTSPLPSSAGLGHSHTHLRSGPPAESAAIDWNRRAGVTAARRPQLGTRRSRRGRRAVPRASRPCEGAGNQGNGNP